MEKVKIEILNELEELHKVRATLEDLGVAWGIDMPVVMKLNHCLEEALTNIIFYAYKDRGKHPVMITFERIDQSSVSILLEDEGRAFNPLEEAEEPDLDAAAEERRIGGLGVFLIKQLMDEVEYTRIGNYNKLKMVKQL